MIFLLRDYHIPLIYLSLLFHGLGLICPFAYSLFITTHPLLPSAPSRAGFRRVLFLAKFFLFSRPLMSFQSLIHFQYCLMAMLTTFRYMATAQLNLFLYSLLQLFLVLML